MNSMWRKIDGVGRNLEPGEIVLMRRFPLRAILLGLAALIALALLAQALRQGLFEAHNEYILTAARAGGVRPGVGVEYAYTMVHGATATKYTEYVVPPAAHQ